jgi:tRNA threonylcarbamoyl adenosine modification protein (Sua5/YciO/YrdC/YwlC family)
MSPKIVEVDVSSPDRGEKVREIAEAMAQGAVAAFPTETVYGLGAAVSDASAVERLVAAKGRAPQHPMALAVSPSQVASLIPDPSETLRRLMRRCWPGPVTLVLNLSEAEPLQELMTDATRQWTAPQGTVGFRVPQNQTMIDVLDTLGTPIVLTSANKTGEPDLNDPRAIAEMFGEEIDLIVDDDSLPTGTPSSVVLVEGNDWKLLREGAVSESIIQRLAAHITVFVCTGNTCRSPLAEVMFRRMAAERLGVASDKLEAQGHVAMSAGLATAYGAPASEGSFLVAQKRGLDLSKHQSQTLSDDMVQYADQILTMTPTHREWILSQHPEATDRIETLAVGGDGVEDPYGGSVEDYERCAECIEREIAIRLDQWNVGESP